MADNNGFKSGNPLNSKSGGNGLNNKNPRNRESP